VTRVFLTGGSGLIGGALGARLVERGDEVVALARSDASERALAGRGMRVVRGDVLDEDAMAAGMAGCALAYHVAGVNTMCPTDPAALTHVNVRGAEAAVRAAARARVPRVVLTSSAAALGEAPGTVGSEESPHRGTYLSEYERSKHEGEVAAFDAARRAGIELVSINPSSVQGPGRASGTGRILIAYLNGRLPAFVETQISLVDIADCVEGHLLGAERGVPGERYVLNGATLSAREALEIVAEVSGVRHRVRFLPPRVAGAGAAMVEALFRVRGRHPPVCREMVRTLVHGHRYDGSRAQRELGLRYTPVADTLRRTIEWARNEGLVRGAVQAVEEPTNAAASGYTKTMEHHEHPAKPQQKDSFEKGVERKPDPPEEDLEPDFARGVRTGEPSEEGRFSEGAEQLPDSPEKHVERRFSEGVERSPDSD
jgi:dihydroflavonol-4-reductase